MNGPADDSDRPDELTERYRRASIGDASRPSEAVRQAIARKAREVAAAGAGQSQPHRFDTSVPAANDGRWMMRAAAGIAVLAIGGLLVFQTFRSSRPGVEPMFRTSDATSEALAPVAPAAEVQAAAPSPAVPPTGTAALATPMPAALGTAELPVATEAARDSARSEAEVRDRQFSRATVDNRARASEPAAVAAPGSAASTAVSWDERATVAARAAYPELFAAAADAGIQRIALVFAADGMLVSSTLGDAPAANAAAERVASVQGLGATLADPQSTGERVLELSTPQGGTIRIAYRVLRR